MTPHVERLIELAALRNAGVLSEEEYAQQKSEVLGLLHVQREDQTDDLEESSVVVRLNDPPRVTAALVYLLKVQANVMLSVDGLTIKTVVWYLMGNRYV